MENDVGDRSFKCIKCGTLNLVNVSQNIMEQERQVEWNIQSSITARSKFKQMCGSKLMNFNDGLLFLMALYEREVLGKIEETPFGVPGTSR